MLNNYPKKCDLLRVARAKGAQRATKWQKKAVFTLSSATQQRNNSAIETLKALADAALTRNNQRNGNATNFENQRNTAQQIDQKNSYFVAQNCAVLRGNEETKNKQKIGQYKRILPPNLPESWLVDFDPYDPDDTRRFCCECSNLKRGFCIKQRYKPIDWPPRHCRDYLALEALR